LKTPSDALLDAVRCRIREHAPDLSPEEVDDHAHHQMEYIAVYRWACTLLGPLYGHPEVEAELKRVAEDCQDANRQFVQRRALEAIERLGQRRVEARTILLPKRWLEFLSRPFLGRDVIEAEFPAVLSGKEFGGWEPIFLEDP